MHRLPRAAWLLAPLLVLVLCGGIWIWAERFPYIAHASSPNDPPWVIEHMRQQRLATNLRPYAKTITVWAAIMLVAGAAFTLRRSAPARSS